MTYLAIDIGGTFTKYALMDEQGTFLRHGKISTETTSLDDFLDSLCRLYTEYSDVVGIAISSAGIIDSQRGFMYNGGSLNFIKNLPISDILEKRCQVPVTIENDAKCAALAELWQGSLADCQNAVAIIIGTAVGGAIIVDRKVLRGKELLAGEFSYIMTDSSDAMNGQKNLAIKGGVPALIAAIATKKGLERATLTGEQIFNWAVAGDEERLLVCEIMPNS